MTAAEVLQPTSAEEAVSLYGDGAAVTVIAGGTIVVPDLTYGRREAARALLLTKAGLDGVTRDGSRVTVGATTPVQELVSFADPLGACAANVADAEVRAQGTVGGNLCAGRGRDAPRGDLQGALLAVDATVKTAGAGGERTQPLEEFLQDRQGRLLLEVSFEEPAAGAYAALDRPHTRDYTALGVSAARAGDGTIRLAATGGTETAVRLRAAESAAADPEEAGQAALQDMTFADDALASAWYRERTLPVLVRRALTQLGES